MPPAAPRVDLPHVVPGLTPEEMPAIESPADVQSITQDTSATFAPALARSKEAAEILGQLAADPQASNVTDLLAVLGRQVEAESRHERWEVVLAIMAGIGKIEQTLPDGSTRRAYGIALKRMTTRAVLREIGALALVPMHHADAAAVLQRAGPDGVEVLMDLLVDSRTVTDRHALFNALAQMKEGSEQLIRLLNDSRWYVVRNAAELIGEMQVEAAVPVLTQLIEHEDERARRAVVLALARIGSSQTVEPLRRALRDRLPGVRLQVAQGIGGRRASPLAMSLVLAMEEEQDPEVERELTLALGRIGSPDAVQALIKLAQPAGRLFGRKPVAKRLAAVDALRLAGTPAAIGTLQGLANDGDKQVRAAAVGALNSLRSREAPSA
jgi:HEAT repeat protein